MSKTRLLQPMSRLLLVVLSGGFLGSFYKVDARIFDIREKHIKPASNLQGISFVSRLFAPYGPTPEQESHPTDEPYAGYAYGMVRASLCVTWNQQQEGSRLA